MKHLGYIFVREELRVIPAKVYQVQYFQEKLVCPVCREEDDTTILAAKTPTPLFPHSLASPDMVATVMYNKRALYLPFYRQANDWQLNGVPLPRKPRRAGLLREHCSILRQFMSASMKNCCDVKSSMPMRFPARFSMKKAGMPEASHICGSI